MIYTVYILYSNSKDKYYIGHTDDLLRRFPEHNTGQCKATKYGVPWIVAFTQVFATRAAAVKFELKIKRMKSRRYIEKLIREG